MKKKKESTVYHWHFWVEKWKVQIIIDDTNYHRAVKRIKQICDIGCNYWNPTPSTFKFQFGCKKA